MGSFRSNFGGGQPLNYNRKIWKEGGYLLVVYFSVRNLFELGFAFRNLLLMRRYLDSHSWWVHFWVQEPKPPNMNLGKYGKVCFRHGLAMSLKKSSLIWTHGPHMAGKSDCQVFTEKLKEKMEEANKRGIRDCGCTGHLEVLTTLQVELFAMHTKFTCEITACVTMLLCWQMRKVAWV